MNLKDKNIEELIQFEPFVIAHAMRIGLLNPESSYLVCFSSIARNRPAIALDIKQIDGSYERYYYRFGIVKCKRSTKRNQRWKYDIGLTHRAQV